MILPTSRPLSRHAQPYASQRGPPTCDSPTSLRNGPLCTCRHCLPLPSHPHLLAGQPSARASRSACGAASGPAAAGCGLFCISLLAARVCVQVALLPHRCCESRLTFCAAASNRPTVCELQPNVQRHAQALRNSYFERARRTSVRGLASGVSGVACYGRRNGG